MFCLNCSEKIIYKLTFSDLFKNREYTLCDYCYYRINYDPTFSVIPIENNNIKIFSLFSTMQSVSATLMPFEYGKLLNVYLKYSNPNTLLLLFENHNELLDNLFLLEKVIGFDFETYCFLEC